MTVVRYMTNGADGERVTLAVVENGTASADMVNTLISIRDIKGEVKVYRIVGMERTITVYNGEISDRDLWFFYCEKMH